MLRLLWNVGTACRAYHNAHVRDPTCKRLQCDEVWGFCGMKQKNVPRKMAGEWGVGDVWVFSGVCAESKLAVSWLVAPRTAESATRFLLDVQGRLAHRGQLSTDRHNMYLSAVENVFGADIDFAQVQKLFGQLKADRPETRYSPGLCCGIKKHRIEGKPDKAHVSTSFTERANLDLRMQNRRFTRLTNAFSRKVANLEASIHPHYFAHNFLKINRMLRTTPAMAAGVADRLWEVEDAVALLDNHEWEGRK